ncbi:hypothetical protein [Chitinophaga sp.]|uniref:hypothetical protein n=1 Tax=Chitinophaga sp. TaxID=1869181 RepID=UPI0031D769C6
MNFDTRKFLASIRPADIAHIVTPELSADQQAKLLFFLTGAFLTPITLAGVLIGYVRGYNLYMRPRQAAPSIGDIPPIVQLSMVIWGVMIWLALLVFVLLLRMIAPLFGDMTPYIPIYLAINVILSVLVYVCFHRWRIDINNHLIESTRFGTARFAREEELSPYQVINNQQNFDPIVLIFFPVFYIFLTRKEFK